MSRNLATIFLVLSAVIAVSWLYLFYQHWQMTSRPMSEMWMPPTKASAWQWMDFWLVYVMWSVMMAAMMLPTAMPMIMVYARICEQRYQNIHAYILFFILAYLLTWLVFSIALTLLQWQMHGLQFLSPMMNLQHTLTAAAIFIFAGLYQFTPLKNKFLQSCRTPMGFLLTEWHTGKAGAFRMGLKHGGECLGCCWAQMLIMFAVGVMSLLGMVFITILVTLEKLVPGQSHFFSKIIGVLFIVWGIGLMTEYL